MIQILGLRQFTRDGEVIKYDAFHEKNWRAPSVPELFADLEKYIAQIPEEERWNIFYTVANCGEGKREFASQDVLAFDIDGVAQEFLEKTIEIALTVLGLSRNDVGLVSSGNGLHILIKLSKPIKDKDFFKKNRAHYRAVVTKLQLAFENAGLSSKPDATVFEPRRILRLPNTQNRKPNKPDTYAKLLNTTLNPVAFDLKTLSGIPEVKPQAQLSPGILKRYPKVEGEAVQSKCKFLNWAKANQNEVTEPQWYALLSVVGRLDNGPALCHEYSKEHRSYKQSETDTKILQAMEASGPRTCENINNIWGGCHECPYNGKIKSPIMLSVDDDIPTKNTGFYKLEYNSKGGVKYVPCYEDLIKFFAKKQPFTVMGGSRMVYIWKDTHYVPIENSELEAFAHEHFDPPPPTAFCREFREKIAYTNIKPVEWFTESPGGRVNFLNGVLTLETGEFFPHSPDIGFRYVLPYSYDELATCPHYDAMLKRVSGGNSSMESVLNEFGGFALAGGPYIPDKALILVGEGANGKTTWINILKAAAGASNFSCLTVDEIKDSEYNRQLIDGKLFNISEETGFKAFKDSSTLKRMVGGGVLQVRRIYKDPYEIINKAKMIITCNQLPPNYDPSFGFNRRLIILPFERTFTKDDPEFDPHVEKKIKTELSGVFNRMYSAYKRLMDNLQFTPCEKSSQEIEEYSLEHDSIKRWFTDNVFHLENGSFHTKFIKLSELFQNYQNKMQVEDVKPQTLPVFGRRLRMLIKNYDKRKGIKKENGIQHRGFHGIDFSDNANLTPSPEPNTQDNIPI